ncbi:MgtC/SapB family protein [Candidatus Falkowbacteria bacterium]|nr:MgtC/SapB family protein [Candidatus Falkowbacteria bacterium]
MYDILIILAKLLLAIILGAIIGYERESIGKPAGSRTYALIALGSALFTILSVDGFGKLPNGNPTSMMGQILIGIGFIGAGLIVYHKHHVEGLTTASALWSIAAIGIAVGLGWYVVAIIASLLVFLLLFIVRRVEFEKNKKKTLWSLFDKK